jgi:hypothetical protein
MMDIKRILYQLFRHLYFNLSHKTPVEPTSQERHLIEVLRKEVEGVEIDISDAMPASERTWNEKMRALKQKVLEEDPRSFLRWEVIFNSMFVWFARFIIPELNHLRRLPSWNDRWKEVLEESPVGQPIPFLLYPKSSGNLIHHAYHLSYLESRIQRKIRDFQFVFEFGGGYGSMCRLFKKLNFQGKYLIYDLPLFSALQRYYLESLEYSLVSISDLGRKDQGITCISEGKLLNDYFSDHSLEKRSLFIATWSISEVPLEPRKDILKFVEMFDCFFIAFQRSFEEVNNLDYFNRWMRELHSFRCEVSELKHLPGNYYLIGESKNQ